MHRTGHSAVYHNEIDQRPCPAVCIAQVADFGSPVYCVHNIHSQQQTINNITSDHPPPHVMGYKSRLFPVGITVTFTVGAAYMDMGAPSSRISRGGDRPYP